MFQMDLLWKHVCVLCGFSPSSLITCHLTKAFNLNSWFIRLKWYLYHFVLFHLYYVSVFVACLFKIFIIPVFSPSISLDVNLYMLLMVTLMDLFAMMKFLCCLQSKPPAICGNWELAMWQEQIRNWFLILLNFN